MARDELAIEHETAFVRSFIVNERRGRYLSQLASPKKRAAILDRLNHRLASDLDQRFIASSPPVSRPPPGQLCYLIADESEYDGRLVRVSAVAEILAAARFGIVVSYVPGELAAYKDEDPADIVWLERS